MSGSPSVPAPLAPHQKFTVAGVVSLFIEILSTQARRHRLMQYKEEKAQLVLDTMQAVRSTSPLLLVGILIVGVAYRCPRYHSFLEAQAQTGSNQAL